MVIEISDNGIGIPGNKLKSIFDPFFSSKNSNTNWGLGLSYAKKVIKLHYGEIRITSELNKGSHFYIICPQQN